MALCVSIAEACAKGGQPCRRCQVPRAKPPTPFIGPLVARLTVFLGYAPVVLLGVLLCSSLGEQDICRNCNHPLLDSTTSLEADVPIF